MNPALRSVRFALPALIRRARSLDQVMLLNLRLELAALLLLLVTPAFVAGATAERTVYSETSNKELRQKALRLVKSIREVLSWYNERDRSVRAEYDKKTRYDTTAAAENERRKRWLDETDDLHDAAMRRYKEQYWSDAILLADEILRRLPKQKRQTYILPVYQHPTNVLGVQAVADHLDVIAKSLPD